MLKEIENALKKYKNF